MKEMLVKRMPYNGIHVYADKSYHARIKAIDGINWSYPGNGDLLMLSLDPRSGIDVVEKRIMELETLPV